MSMYVTKDINWTLWPAVAVGFNGSKCVNYSLSIVVSWLRWHWHFGWYEGNDSKAPF